MSKFWKTKKLHINRAGHLRGFVRTALKKRSFPLPVCAVRFLFGIGTVLLAVFASSQTLAQSLPQPDLSSGHVALDFQARTTDGKSVSFPADYKGKLVLLDFWATWCGPCRAEVPNIAAACKKFNSKGFEVLGVSLDNAGDADKLARFTMENYMAWPQIYDGKGWQAEIARRCSISSIPHPLLIDGDTGRILAAGDYLRGKGLSAALEKALAPGAKEERQREIAQDQQRRRIEEEERRNQIARLTDHDESAKEIFKLQPTDQFSVKEITEFLITWKNKHLDSLLRNASLSELRDYADQIEHTILETTDASEKEKDEAQSLVAAGGATENQHTALARAYRLRIEILKPILAAIKGEIANRGK